MPTSEQDRAACNDRDHASALFGRLRALRCRAQGLRDFVAKLEARASSLADPAVRGYELSKAFERERPSFDDDSREIERLLGEIRAILEQDDRLYCAWGDGIATIESEWQKTLNGRRALALHAFDAAGQQYTEVITALDNVVYQCCEITIPDRITYHLSLLPIGAALNFRDAYCVELPLAEQRQRFLQYLNLYPGFVAGLVDIGNERILRASDKRWRRGISLAATVFIALAGFLAITLVSLLGGATSHAGDRWPFTQDRLQQHLSEYAFLLLGAIAHVMILLLKQDRAAAATPQYLSDWILRIHVREAAYFLSALSLWLGLAASAFLFPNGAGWKTAFFLGYSYDSFVDLFIKRFEGAVPAASSLLGAAPAPPATPPHVPALS
jgi:hypothetical protein